jgi:hypothetical protein
MSSPPAQPPTERRRVVTRARLMPKGALLGLGFLLFLAGPVTAIGLSASVLWQIRNSVERATAEVVSVRISQSGDSTHYCPMFRWQDRGVEQVHESAYCGDHGDFAKGQHVAVRFAPGDPESVRPDTAFAMYGGAAIGVPMTLIPTALLFACISGWRRRRRLEAEGKVAPDGTIEVAVFVGGRSPKR